MSSYMKMGIDLKKIQNGQMSPVLHNSSSKAISNPKLQLSARQSKEAFGDLTKKSTKLERQGPLNKTEHHAQSDSRQLLKNAAVLASVSLRQRQSKSTKFTPTPNDAPSISNQDSQNKQQYVPKQAIDLKKSQYLTKNVQAKL